jgi:hypothetical protein
VTSFGPVAVTGNSRLDVSNPFNLGSGGSVFIRAGALAIDASDINADNFGSGPGGKLVLRADGDITITGGSGVDAVTFGSGNGSDIIVRAGQLIIREALITTGSNGFGTSGKISVSVADQLLIDGGPGVVTTGISSSSTATFNRDTMVTTVIPGTSGVPGNITVKAGGLLELANFGEISSFTSGVGTAGDVTVNAEVASISNISEIDAGTHGPGNAGNVRVSISGSLAIVGPPSGDINNFTGIGTVAGPGSTGNAGSVSVNAGSLLISGLVGEISSSTLSSGAAGKVSVDVAGTLFDCGVTR